jgi:hypothetical protein
VLPAARATGVSAPAVTAVVGTPGGTRASASSTSVVVPVRVNANTRS